MAVSFISIAPIIVKTPVPGTAPSSAAAPSDPTAPDFQSVLAGETSAPTAPSGPYVPGTLPAVFAEPSASSKACAKGVVAAGSAAAASPKAQIALDPATPPTTPGSAVREPESGGIDMSKPMTKSELIGQIAEHAKLKRSDVKGVMETLATIGYKELKKNGTFLLPGFAKFVVIKKPATKERSGINPFTKEPTVFKARPARKIVRARPVKAAKDAV
jgi:nucleoid DNA-binding protein